MCNTYEFVDRKQVRLGEGVLDLENIREIVHCSVSALQGEASLVLEAPCRIYSHRNTGTLIFALRESFDVFEITNCPSK